MINNGENSGLARTIIGGDGEVARPDGLVRLHIVHHPHDGVEDTHIGASKGKLVPLKGGVSIGNDVANSVNIESSHKMTSCPLADGTADFHYISVSSLPLYYSIFRACCQHEKRMLLALDKHGLCCIMEMYTGGAKPPTTRPQIRAAHRLCVNSYHQFLSTGPGGASVRKKETMENIVAPVIAEGKQLEPGEDILEMFRTRNNPTGNPIPVEKAQQIRESVVKPQKPIKTEPVKKVPKPVPIQNPTAPVKAPEICPVKDSNADKIRRLKAALVASLALSTLALLTWVALQTGDITSRLAYPIIGMSYIAAFIFSAVVWIKNKEE